MKTRMVKIGVSLWAVIILMAGPLNADTTSVESADSLSALWLVGDSKWSLESRIALERDLYDCVPPEDTIINVRYSVQPFKQDVAPPEWYFYLLVGILGMFVFVWVSFQRNILVLIRAVYNIRIEEQLYRQEENNVPPYALLLTILFYLVGGFYVFYLIKFTGWELPLESFSLYSACVGVLAGIYSLRYITMKMVKVLFPFGAVVDFYSFTISLINRFLGIILIPFLFVFAYGFNRLVEAGIYVSLGLVAIVLLLRIIRGFIVAWDYIVFHKFYFFVYLCTLELAPLFIFLKVLKSI